MTERILTGRILSYRYLAVLLLFVVTACSHGGSNDSNSNTATDNTASSDLSGTIAATASSATDSDTNDIYATAIPNDTFAEAQVIANPVTLGGYVNQRDSGPDGRSFAGGDVKDFFKADLIKGQTVSLLIADTAGGDNDLDLFLYDDSQTLVDSSVSTSASTETVTVPTTATTGRFYIEVRAVSGASAYVLSIGAVPAKAMSASQISLPATGADFVPGEVIVRFKDMPQGVTMNELAYRASAVGMQVKAGGAGRDMLMQVGTGAARAATFSALGIQLTAQAADPKLQARLDTLTVINALRQRNDVASARLNRIYYPAAVPNDTYYNLQWDYAHMNLPQAWDVTKGSSSVIVAVIDTGVLLNHPDLEGQLVSGYDFIRDATNAADNEAATTASDIDADPDDPGDGNGGSSSFHGTHVAGTIAAATDNNLGVAGVAWNAKIMPMRALGINGGTEYDIEQAMLYAAGLKNDSGTLPSQKADIINLSLGGPINVIGDPPQAFIDARAAGVIIVAAAGNDASNSLYFPASLDGVVSVSAVDASNNLAPYSNYGSTIDIAAPGGDMTADINGDGRPDGILSTLGNDSSGSIEFVYGFYQGTSMAAPHIAGVAALMKSVYPGMTPDEFDTFIQSGSITTQLGNAVRDDQFGYGVIDAYKAVEAAYKAANSGALPTIPPVAVASPASLNFSYNKSTLTMALSNGGGGSLSVTDISNDSGGWLAVTPAVSGDGLGTYTVTVNRDLVPDTSISTYTATITVVNDASPDPLTIPVIMQLDKAAFSSNAGNLFGLLVKTDYSDAITVEVGEPSDGVYSLQFAGDTAAPPGDYFLVAGSDTNNDDYICDPAESCGAYPTLGSPSIITITGDGVALTGKNFEAGYSSFSPTMAGTSTAIAIPPRGFRIDKSLLQKGH
jgi:serine protease